MYKESRVVLRSPKKIKRVILAKIGSIRPKKDYVIDVAKADDFLP